MLKIDRFDMTSDPEALAEDEIHLWFCPLWVNSDKPGGTLRSDAQLCLRNLLGAYLGRSVCDADFALGAHGRPALREVPRLGFNLSHSFGAALIALGWDLQPGVDVEYTGRTRVRPVQALAERYFCSAEAARLADLAPSQAQLAFLALWTAKEAVVKAIGRGLAFGLHRLEFSLDERGWPIALVAIANEGGTPDSWQCRAVLPDPGYHGSIAWNGGPRRICAFRLADAG